LEEVRAAIEGIRFVSQELPIIATMTFDTNGRTMMGVTPEKAMKKLASFGAMVVGGNCGNGPEEIIELARKTPDSMVAMCTHGRSGMGRWVLGSVTDRIVSNCGAPVLVIRPSAVMT